MTPLIISKEQARKIILHAGGLAKPGQFGKGKEAVYKVIEHLGFVQIDTIAVVERAHHHALASRVADYDHDWLQVLQTEGRIFEFWTYASGFIPMKNFRFSLPVKESFSSRRKALTQTEINLMNKILDRISREGPLRSRDFENDRVTKSSGWWDWRPSKVALERLHLDGRLVSIRRKDFQKLYDLGENIIPPDVDQTMPDDAEFARHIILRVLKAHGIASMKEIAYSSRHAKNTAKTEIDKLIVSGEVYNVAVDGLKSSPLYMLAEYRNKKIKLSDSVFILSPFDVLNVFRHRLKWFFDFDYQVECFVPAPKRKYGYFSLPILAGDAFIGRMDCKADRKQRHLIVNNLHLESKTIDSTLLKKLSEAIKTFATFNSCDRIAIKKSNAPTFLKALRKILP
ncbi:MAG: crosslink repair DNA glycosylase YcaQ family protein [Chryseolinea sp.]